MVKSMKKFFGLLALLVCSMCLMTSCSKEDDPAGSSDEIVGRWKMVREIWKESANGHVYSSGDEDCSDDNCVWDFQEGGKFCVYEDNELVNTQEWAVSGNQLTIQGWDDGEQEYVTEKYSWSISSGKLIIVFIEKEGDEEVYAEWHFVREGQSGGGSGVTEPDDDDDDEPNIPGPSASSIVGNWKVVRTTTKRYFLIPEMKDYNSESVSEGNGEYWEFTSTKLTIHDPADLMNGTPVSYVYNKENGTLSVNAISSPYQVTELTSQRLTLESDSHDDTAGVTVIIEFIRQ